MIVCKKLPLRLRDQRETAMDTSASSQNENLHEMMRLGPIRVSTKAIVHRERSDAGVTRQENSMAY